MTAYLCPVFQENQFSDDVSFLSGGLLWFYVAGTSTLQTAYTTDAGDVAWPNPIVLDARGEAGGSIWLAEGQSYRIVLESAPIYGQTHGVVITEFDDVVGINDASVVTPTSAFAILNADPNYVTSSSFSVSGDYRFLFVTNRKLRLTDSGGTSIHSVILSTYAAGVTTVAITGLIDSGISLIEYSLIPPDASPDRFNYVSITQDLTVSGDTVLDGDAIISGSASVNGGNIWTHINCPASLAVNSYQSFESGALIQGGVGTSNSSGTGIVTLPTAYAHGYTVVCTAKQTSSIFDAVVATVYQTKTLTSFSVYLQDATGTAEPNYDFYWITIGY